MQYIFYLNFNSSGIIYKKNLPKKGTLLLAIWD